MSPQRASPHREMASVIPLAHLLHVRARDRMPRRGREHSLPPIYFSGWEGEASSISRGYSTRSHGLWF